MSWRKVSDDLHSHPKWVEISLAARGLWITTLSWTGERLTDGAVPEQLVKQYAGTAAKKLAAELVSAGLWDVNPSGGWQFHDYHDYQPTSYEEREDKANLSHVRSEAGKRGAAKRWANHSKEDSKPDSKPMPPYPVSLATNVASSAGVPESDQAPAPETVSEPDRDPFEPAPTNPKDARIEALIAERRKVIADHPHWDAELARRTPRDCTNRVAYQAKIWRDWVRHEENAPPVPPPPAAVVGFDLGECRPLPDEKPSAFLKRQAEYAAAVRDRVGATAQ